jgi:hypothetical protein
VAEVAAHRLIFLDSRHSLYHVLVLAFLVLVLAERAQPVAAREVMRASFEAFLMVLLAGGNERSFARADHAAVEEDLRSLKRAFCTCREGLVPEDVVAREAGTAEAVVDLMARSTECLIEAFCVAAAESAGGGKGGATSLPPTMREARPRSGGQEGAAEMADPAARRRLEDDEALPPGTRRRGRRPGLPYPSASPARDAVVAAPAAPCRGAAVSLVALLLPGSAWSPTAAQARPWRRWPARGGALPATPRRPTTRLHPAPRHASASSPRRASASSPRRASASVPRGLPAAVSSSLLLPAGSPGLRPARPPARMPLR